MSIKKNLALAHKIISILEMDDLTYTHISHKSDEDHFYISPFGLLYEEVNENNLVKLGLNGKISEDSDYKIFNPTGLLVHSAIYKARPDINAVIHLHTNATIAISSMKSGLLPLSQHALHFYNLISYHDYDSMLLDEKTQAKKIAEDLAQNNVMFLRNHGFITCGKTIQEALFYAYHLERASIIQTMILQSNNDYILPSQEICQKACDDLLSFEKGLGRRDWEAWVRKIDRLNKEKVISKNIETFFSPISSSTSYYELVKS